MGATDATGPGGLAALNYFTYIGCQNIFSVNNTVTPGFLGSVVTNKYCAQASPNMLYIAAATYPCTFCTPPYNRTYCYGSMTNYGTANDATGQCTNYFGGNANDFCGGYKPGQSIFTTFLEI